MIGGARGFQECQTMIVISLYLDGVFAYRKLQSPIDANQNKKLPRHSRKRGNPLAKRA